MKQTITAAICAACFLLVSPSAQAQFVESFENPGGISYYESQDWKFYGASWDNTSKIERTGSIKVIPTTSTNNNAHAQSNVSQIITPTLTFPKDRVTTLSFSYKLTSNLHSNAARTFNVWLYSDDGLPSLSLLSFTIVGSLTSALQPYISPTIKIPAGTSAKRLVIDFTGDGDGNTGMYFDNISLDNATVVSTLPVKLTGFNGALFNSKAELLWTVDTNEDGDYFEVEKSNNGKDFNSAALLFTTNSNGTETYRYKENAPLTNTAYYRLKLVNKNKTYTYSNIICIKKEASKNTNLKLASGTGISTIQFLYSSASNEKSQISVYNSAGTIVYSQTETLQRGINAISVPFHNALIKGTYILEVKGAYERATLSFFKQ